MNYAQQYKDHANPIINLFTHIYKPNSYKHIVRSRTPYVQKRTDMILHHPTKQNSISTNDEQIPMEPAFLCSICIYKC